MYCELWGILSHNFDSPLIVSSECKRTKMISDGGAVERGSELPLSTRKIWSEIGLTNQISS